MSVLGLLTPDGFAAGFVVVGVVHEPVEGYYGEVGWEDFTGHYLKALVTKFKKSFGLVLVELAVLRLNPDNVKNSTLLNSDERQVALMSKYAEFFGSLELRGHLHGKTLFTQILISQSVLFVAL
ncbi:hypothetical protein [Corynebacterium phocae]|uniref:hypothetical protein n=1 Tax=Corynebacterium phocae TaxID=161895 RepID=UPI0012393A9B|nr:hypothetical protein [Corynebacterium phocae]KAA8721564.1 hypothetical protein F4V58_09945 [Corynebacterium phocae]